MGLSLAISRVFTVSNIDHNWSASDAYRMYIPLLIQRGKIWTEGDRKIKKVIVISPNVRYRLGIPRSRICISRLAEKRRPGIGVERSEFGIHGKVIAAKESFDTAVQLVLSILHRGRLENEDIGVGGLRS